MPKNREDIVEDEVRRRVANILSSAGVDYGRVSLEVLLDLPSEFVRMYKDLYWQALSEDVSSSHITSQTPTRGVRKEGVGAREIQLSGGGKRYKVHWIIRDELALKLKKSLDKKLVRAAEGALKELRKERTRKRDERDREQLNGAAGKIDEVAPAPEREEEDGPEETGGLRNYGDGQRRCGRCGRIAADSWQRCPYHEE